MEINQDLQASQSQVPPQIIKYKDYRQFLQDYYNFRKSQRRGFSFRQFASLVGLKSPNYLQLVIQGKRNLSPETGERIAQVLKLNAPETQYFVALIKAQEARNDKEREAALRQIRMATKRLSTTLVPKLQQEVLSKWHHLAVRELVLLKDFEPTGEYISKKLNGLISKAEGEASLRYLIQSGFVGIGEDGSYQLAEPVLSTGVEEFFHSQLQELHAQMLMKWAKNLDKLCSREQELHYINIPLNSSKMAEFKKRVSDFQEEIIGWLQDEDEPDRLVQLGTYLIPFDK